MTAVLENYPSFMNGGHPVLRQTFLVGSVKPMITTVLAYVLFVKYVGPIIMRDRKPMNLRGLIIIHNIFLVGYNLHFLIKGMYFIHGLGFSTFCGQNLDGNDPFVVEAYNHVYIAYAVRYIELLDTVFLVLSKKFEMVTFFHVFHHASVPVLWWISLRTEAGTYLTFYIGFNSFVHTIMYTYYGIAALGPKYQKYIWWKKYLTILQISQFFVLGIYFIIMYAIGCVSSKLILSIAMFFCLLFSYLFIKYYRDAYLKQVLKREQHLNGSCQSSQKSSFDKTK